MVDQNLIKATETYKSDLQKVAKLFSGYSATYQQLKPPNQKPLKQKPLAFKQEKLCQLEKELVSILKSVIDTIKDQYKTIKDQYKKIEGIPLDAIKINNIEKIQKLTLSLGAIYNAYDNFHYWADGYNTPDTPLPDIENLIEEIINNFNKLKEVELLKPEVPFKIEKEFNILKQIRENPVICRYQEKLQQLKNALVPPPKETEEKKVSSKEKKVSSEETEKQKTMTDEAKFKATCERFNREFTSVFLVLMEQVQQKFLEVNANSPIANQEVSEFTKDLEIIYKVQNEISYWLGSFEDAHVDLWKDPNTYANLSPQTGLQQLIEEKLIDSAQQKRLEIQITQLEEYKENYKDKKVLQPFREIRERMLKEEISDPPELKFKEERIKQCGKTASLTYEMAKKNLKQIFNDMLEPYKSHENDELNEDKYGPIKQARKKMQSKNLVEREAGRKEIEDITREIQQIETSVNQMFNLLADYTLNQFSTSAKSVVYNNTPNVFQQLITQLSRLEKLAAGNPLQLKNYEELRDSLMYLGKKELPPSLQPSMSDSVTRSERSGSFLLGGMLSMFGIGSKGKETKGVDLPGADDSKDTPKPSSSK